jgi:hypothetical protein
LFIAGGYAAPYFIEDTFEEASNETIGCDEYTNRTLAGAGFINKAWIFDGTSWNAIPDMNVTRDFPACSLVEMDDGEVSGHRVIMCTNQGYA